MSTGVIAGLIWIGFAAHRPRTARSSVARYTEGRSRMASSAVPDVVVIDNVGWRDIGGCDGPVATRRRAHQQPVTRQMPGEELTGYS